MTSLHIFFKRSLVIALSGACIVGCCTKDDDCDGVNGITSIDVAGYTIGEADTLRVVRYAENDGFSRALDSSETRVQFLNRDTANNRYEIYIFLPAGYNYRITFPNATRSHTVSGILLEQRLCSRCIWDRQYTTNLLSAVVDGQLSEAGDLILRR